MRTELSIFYRTSIFSLEDEFYSEATLESELEFILQSVEFVGDILLGNSLEDLYRTLLNKIDGIVFEERYGDTLDEQYCLIISELSGASIVIPPLSVYVLCLDKDFSF